MRGNSVPASRWCSVGGNLLRGAELAAAGMDRVTADHMGMLATCMNGLAFRDALVRAGVPARVWSGLVVPGVLPAYEVEACAPRWPAMRSRC